MILAQEFAGIPISLPAWTQYAAWAIVALLALLIGVLIWRGILNTRKNTLLGETHAKTNLILLILRGYQERDEQNQGYEQLANEHYSADLGPNEITDQHERINK